MFAAESFRIGLEMVIWDGYESRWIDMVCEAT
jgi:hypothetical protein